ncbi:hypothetical protein EUU23_09435 [Sphingorhabdus sp. IMCC26285]|uniref:Peptidase C14 caspase domain-containing protein n=1 Tax=Sphingorhabdus profundilacus TaxID=2509718 RepID=A0A6I4M5N3_9SPHN|nr:caspase family protein [Sphingorhabdus profundilacus]MVZ97928.1 hypothetical protein [Sphingorhabdus profundilacus]
MPDHAIVVGIGHYPTLGAGGKQPNDLPGAVEDANEMAAWLAEQGGATVTKITSTGLNDGPWEVASIRPNGQDVEDAFKPFVTADNRVGSRLTVFMAGHGIAPAARSRSLILADAQNSKQPWVPACEASAWIDWFALQTQFDEFVLWMDCCGNTGLEYERRGPPVRRGVSRAGNAAPVFMAFASGNGREAYEGPTKDGVIRGYFTDRLLAGLGGAAVGLDGEVRSASLASFLRNESAVVVDGNTPSAPARPPADVVQQDDLLFAKHPFPNYEFRIRDTQGNILPDGTTVTAYRPNSEFNLKGDVQGGWVSFNLPVGLVKLTAPGIEKYMEIAAAAEKRIEA